MNEVIIAFLESCPHGRKDLVIGVLSLSMKNFKSVSELLRTLQNDNVSCIQSISRPWMKIG